MTPLGVIITPPGAVKVSKELRAALPAKAVVRILRTTELRPGGETTVVYESGDEFDAEPHVAIVRGNHVVADFELTALFLDEGVGSSYATFKTAQIQTGGKQHFLAVFRNIGDGSRTAFAGVVGTKDGYEVDLKEWTTQGRVELLTGGDLRVWSAEDEGQCTWCPHRYDVSKLRWRNGKLVEISKFKTRKALDPATIANNPIVVEK